MKISHLHDWDLTPSEAIALQRDLASKIDITKPLRHCEFIAGADVSYGRFSSTFYAMVVVLRMSDMAIVESQGAVRETPFPYVPGLLSFREAPALLDAFARLKLTPDVVMLDGQGYAHPRRFGLACHVGLWLDLPCLGCAKSRLVGEHKEPGIRAGSEAALKDHGETIGSVVRSKDKVRPLYVSPGHTIDRETTVELVLKSCRGYRVPEPTRQAHLLVNQLRRDAAC